MSKEMTGESARAPTVKTDSVVESNSQKEIPELPIKPSTPPLTMENVGGIEPLYNSYIKGELVEFPPWIIETKDKLEICPQELYIYISETQNILSVKLGNSKGIVLYIYRNGYYQLWTESDCKAFVKAYLPRRIRKSCMWEMVYKELITEYANTEESDLNANEDIINFRNGIYNLKTGKLEPHSPKYLSSIQIPCNFTADLKLEDAPVATKFLNDITGGNLEDIDTLLEILGAIISNIKCSRFKKLLILKGPGNTGKSVWREFAIKLVGLANTHTLDIKQLHGTFGLGGIYAKRLIGSGDMKFSRLPEIDKIKELTGGDHVNIEMKYQNSFTTQFRGFLLFSTNDLPAFGGDKGKHVYDRFIIISCDNPIPPEQRDPQLLEKLLEEKEIIVSVAIQHLQKAIARGYKFTESERTIKNREDYAIRNNSLALFLKECCIIGQGRTITSVFKEKYKSWCRDNNLEPEKSNDITRILVNDYRIVKRKSDRDYYELKIK